MKKKPLTSKKELKFKPLKNTFGVEGMTTANIRGLINYFAGKSTVFLEIGSYKGQTLCSAAYKNPNTICIGVDNFSQFNKLGENERILKEAIKPFPNIEFWKMEAIEAIKEIDKKGIKVGCFFYDGDHSLAATLDALTAIESLMTEDGIIIVDDTNFEDVDNAVKMFLKSGKWDVVFEKSTPKKVNGHKDWWNGIVVLQRKVMSDEF